MRKKKILIYMYSLGGGGVQRFIINLLTHINKDKYELKIALVKNDGVYLKELPKGLEVIDLEAKNIPASLYPLIKVIRKVKPDIIFSIDTSINIVAILARILSFSRAKNIIRQAVNISKHSTSLSKRILVNLLYNFSKCCVVLSFDMLKNMQKFNMKYSKIKIIHNAVNIEKISYLYEEPIDDYDFSSSDFTIVSVGRLTRQKNQKFLIQAFNELSAKLDVKLLLIGEGEDREELEALIKESNLENKINLLGFKSNPYKYMKKSDVFILTSLYEGLSNAMIEAIACELPIVTTDNPDQIIKNNINGFHTSLDQKLIVNSLLKILTDHSLLNNMTNYNKEYKENFNVDKLVIEYEKVFDEF